MSKPSRNRRSEVCPEQASGAGGANPSIGSRLTRRQQWVFRLLAMFLFPLLVLGGLEGALRFCGAGYSTSFFLHKDLNGQKVLVPNDKFGWRFFGPKLARTPRPMVIPEAKPPGTIRIFLFGESAAFGDPRPDFGLPRVLEVLLRNRYPGFRFEIINAAMTGINSHVILPIAKECAQYHGDVWVLYMGNNEVVGPYGAGTVFGARTPPLPVIRTSAALKATRIGEWISQLLTTASKTPQMQEWGMGLFLRNQVGHDDPRLARVYSHFARNLDDILEIGRQSGVKIVLSTMVSNLKDCSPFGSQHRLDLTSAQIAQWQTFYQAGCDAQRAGRPEAAIESFEKAGLLDDEFAELDYRWGLCCLTAGQKIEARSHFIRARDYDTLRFRADSRINEVIRTKAAGQSQNGVLLADAETDLARQAADGLAGNECLYEHVHLNFEGNCQLGRQIAEQIGKCLPQLETQNPLGKWKSSAEIAEHLAWSDWERYKALKLVWLRFNDAPFTGQFDHEARCLNLRRQLEEATLASRPVALRRQGDQYRRALSVAPEDWVLQRNSGDLFLAIGELRDAEACYREVIRLLPFEAVNYLQLGLLLIQAGRLEEAVAKLEEGLNLDSGSAPLLNGLALALMRMGKSQEALERFRQALNLNPNNAETHLNLGTALETMKRTEEAEHEFHLALAANSGSAETLLRAGRLALSHGWTDAALTNLQRATQLSPADAPAHFYLAGAWEAKGRTAEAQTELAETVRLAPDHARARVGLGVELMRRGNEDSALEQFAEAARLQPDLVEARLRLGLALAHQNKAREARREFQEVLRLDPDNRTARTGLAGLGQQ